MALKTLRTEIGSARRSIIGKRVLIHASLKSANFWYSPPEISKIADNFISEISNSGTDWSRYPHGAIIGSVVIADCVQNHPSVWAEKGAYNWVLKDAILFDKPIEGVKGKLGFWDFNTKD